MADNRTERQKQLDAAIHQLGEHYEAVEVLVSWTEDGKTSFESRGSGNWYARAGMAREFLNRDQSEVAAIAVATEMKGDDE